MLVEMHVPSASPGGTLFRMGYTSLGRRFKKAVRLADLNEMISFHTLRHSFASALVAAGVDLASVRELLGHRDIATTMIYAHIAPEHLSGTVEKLPF